MSVQGLMKWGEIKTEQVMVAILFGTNLLLFLLFKYINHKEAQTRLSVTNGEDGVELLERAEDGSTVAKQSSKEVAHAPVKQLTKPFIASLECYTTLTTEMFRLGVLLGFTYVCERHWYFEHSGKEYSRDKFLFILVIFFLYAFWTIKPIKDRSVLGREQTEEWKGWMQFIFLLYHYFHAEEVYNSVRVMITCYVWMTGFGNFSFFYIKQDFGWLRLMQMMWRLNFTVLLLMWTHGNTWILYYICPMHTFYFLMVFVSMYCYKSINHTKMGIRWKLVVLGLIIYLVWDINGGIFDFVFAWMGTDSIIGAKSGSVWEYYFRTSLDHWSSYLGMIFALNYPLVDQYYTKAAASPSAAALYLCSGILGALTIWWVVVIYAKPKMEYNLVHSYFAIIPLTSYIFFRNLSIPLRGFVSMSLHDLGKTTLETYLLQHHIWLTSNAKTLLTWIPDHPYVNFAFATIVFFVVAKELYRLTMSLRGLVLPDDQDIARRNLAGAVVVTLVCFLVAFAIHNAEMQNLLSAYIAACTALSAVVIQIAYRRGQTLSNDSPVFTASANKATGICVVVAFLALLVALSSGNIDSVALGDAAAKDGPVTFLSRGESPLSGSNEFHSAVSSKCSSNLSKGHWFESECKRRQLHTLDNTSIDSRDDSSRKLTDNALCRTNRWVWNSEDMLSDGTSCPSPAKISRETAKKMLSGKRVVFYGDSVTRQTYHQFNALLDHKYDPITPVSFDTKHSNLNHHVSDSNTDVSFTWAPLLVNMTNAISINEEEKAADFIVAGAGLWDALHVRDTNTFRENLSVLKEKLKLVKNRAAAQDVKLEALKPTHGSTTIIPASKKVPVILWLQPTTIFDARLATAEKKQYMSEDIVATYRKEAETSLVGKQDEAVDFILDPTYVTSARQEATMDGIHFVDDIYKVISQMILNAYNFRVPYVSPSIANAPYVPKATGSMSFPGYGLGVLVLSCLMLFGFDNFLGFGYASLALFKDKVDWDTAYIPLLKKIGVAASGMSTGGASVAASGSDVSEAPAAPAKTAA